MMRVFLSEGFMSGRSLCPDGVMYGGGFVRGRFCPEGDLSRILLASVFNRVLEEPHTYPPTFSSHGATVLQTSTAVDRSGGGLLLLYYRQARQ